MVSSPQLRFLVSRFLYAWKRQGETDRQGDRGGAGWGGSGGVGCQQDLNQILSHRCCDPHIE